MAMIASVIAASAHGLERAKDFSWDKCATQVLKVFDYVMQPKGAGAGAARRRLTLSQRPGIHALAATNTFSPRCRP
jgi:hypothetical protein